MDDNGDTWEFGIVGTPPRMDRRLIPCICLYVVPTDGTGATVMSRLDGILFVFYGIR